MINKKIFLLMLSMTLLVGIVSAANFDNVGDYSYENREMKITNAFGFGGEIAKIRLLSDDNQKVMRGKDRLVAEFEITGSNNYEEVFNKMEFFDAKTMIPLDRSFVYKVKVSKQELVPQRETTCYIIEGGRERCISEIVGYKNENVYSWEEIDSKEGLNAGKKTIGIFTEVLAGDNVEWIPTLYGVRIPQWAVWTDSLDVGLEAYYDFQDNSTNYAFDVSNNVANFTGTLEDGINYTSQGKLGNGMNFPGAGGINTTGILNITGNHSRSVFVWVNESNSGAGTHGIASWGSASVNNEQSSLGLNRGAGQIRFTARNNDFFSSGWSTTFSGNFYFVGFTYDASGNMTMWVNGSAVGETTINVATISSKIVLGNLIEGGAWPMSGTLDELMIYNRSLTPSEITQLYNNGAGLPFQSGVGVTLNSPADAFQSPVNEIIFNGTAETEASKTIANITLWHDASGTFELNQSQSFSGNENETTTFNVSFPDGDYVWNMQSCNNESTCEFALSNRTFTIDTTDPSVVVTAPTGNIGSFVFGDNLSTNWTITDPHLESCWLDYNSINTSLTCGDNNFSFTPVTGKQSLIIWANDTLGNTGFNTTNWEYSFIENNATFNASTQETSQEQFILNLTSDLTVLSISAFLDYNGTEYVSTASCEGNQCLLENQIDVSLVEVGSSELHDFSWNFTIFNGTDSVNIKSSVREQNVSRIHLELCNATWTQDTLNFTTYDEQNLSRISPFQFDGTFNFWTGSGTIQRNNSFSMNDTEVNLCLDPSVNMKTSAVINYDEANNGTLYTDRFYYFDQHLINSTIQDIPFYLLKSTESTSFILKVQDENLLPVKDALIEIQRFYPGTNEFRIVQIAKTDDNGKSIGFFETETVDYRFIIKKGGITLLETGIQKVVPETSPFTLTFNTGTDLGEPWQSQNNIPLLNSSLTWDEDTGIVTYTYIDVSGNFTLGRLLVQEQSFLNSSAYVTLCNENSTLSSATLTCNVGNSSGFYLAGGYITRMGEALDEQINFQIETFSSQAGLLGLFFGFFLILISTSMFKFNEVAGIWSTTITILMVNLFGLIKFGGVFVTAIIGIAIILTWIMDK